MKHILLDRNFYDVDSLIIREDKEKAIGRAVIWIPNDWVVMHRISLPIQASQNLSVAVEFAMEDILLNDIDLYTISYQVVERAKDTLHVVAMAISTSLLNEIIDFAQDRNLNIFGIYPMSFLLPIKESSCVILLDAKGALIHLNDGTGLFLPEFALSDNWVINHIVNHSPLPKGDVGANINNDTDNGNDDLDIQNTVLLLATKDAKLPHDLQDITHVVNHIVDVISWDDLKLPKLNFFSSRSKFSFSFGKKLSLFSSSGSKVPLRVVSIFLFSCMLALSASIFAYIKNSKSLTRQANNALIAIFPEDGSKAKQALKRQISVMKKRLSKRDESLWVNVRKLGSLLSSCHKCRVVELLYSPEKVTVRINTGGSENISANNIRLQLGAKVSEAPASVDKVDVNKEEAKVDTGKELEIVWKNTANQIKVEQEKSKQNKEKDAPRNMLAPIKNSEKK